MSATGRRKLLSSVFVAFCAGAVILALVPLAFVLFFVISQGVQSLNLAFFTHLPTPVANARLYVSGRNLATFTGYKGMDPEVSTAGLTPGNDTRDQYPTTRMFTAGMTLSF